MMQVKQTPIFVLELCRKWDKESQTKETTYIIKKALRTLEKKNKSNVRYLTFLNGSLLYSNTPNR